MKQYGKMISTQTLDLILAYNTWHFTILERNGVFPIIRTTSKIDHFSNAEPYQRSCRGQQHWQPHRWSCAVQSRVRFWSSVHPGRLSKKKWINEIKLFKFAHRQSSAVRLPRISGFVEFLVDLVRINQDCLKISYPNLFFPHLLVQECIEK